MNCATIKRLHQSDITIAIPTNTKLLPLSLTTASSTSYLKLHTSISSCGYDLKNIEKVQSISIATVKNCNIKTERPTPPPRAVKAAKALQVAITTAGASAEQTLMIKSIENLSSHANDVEKDEEEEEKEICNEPKRRDSNTEDIGLTVNNSTNKFKTVQEQQSEEKDTNNTNNTTTKTETNENIFPTTSSNNNIPEIVDIAASGAAAPPAAKEAAPASAPLTIENTNSPTSANIEEVTDAPVLNATAPEQQATVASTESNKSTNLTEYIVTQTSTTPTTTAIATAITTAAASSAVECQIGSEVDKVAAEEESNRRQSSGGVEVVPLPSTTTDVATPSTAATVEGSLSRNNSAGLGRTKLSKTPSFTKISNSLQSSLGVLSGGGAIGSRPDEDTISKSSDTSGELVRGVAADSGTCDKPKSASRLSERAKKKSWYNVLYPNYKSRADDFKKLFKEVPSDERLIVDYSCALQRDILVQGRLYVSQNYVCFHANIFRWETYLTIRWKDVTSITKEKTALVIPNAISICTAKEKYFFATFTTRDKAFLMLFRVWQNTLMNKQMPPQEIWQWVHNCYGDELGLTTDDEDYIDPNTAKQSENDSGDIEFLLAQEQQDSERDTQSSCISSTAAFTSDYSTAQSTINNACLLSSSASSTGTGGGAGVIKFRKKSYFFGTNKALGGEGGGGGNNSSTTTTSTSGSDNKTSDNNSGERESSIKCIMNAKELTLTSMKPEEDIGGGGGRSKINNTANDSGGSGGASSAASRETKSSTLKAVVHDAKRKMPPKTTRERDEAASNNQTNLPTDASGSSDSEESKVPFIATAECTSPHEGRQYLHTILPTNVDTLFNMLFTKSKFFTEFHAMRKTENMVFGDWITDEDGKKKRTISLTVQLLASVGPKVSRVTEVQEMRECSKPGELYSIDVTSTNAGIPYADSFSVLMHYCLVRTVDDHTMLSVHSQVKYKKSIWGVVKGFIEKNTWAGLEEYYNSLQQTLQSEICIPPAKAKGRRPRRGNAAQSRPSEDVPEAQIKAESIEVATTAASRRHTQGLPVAVVQQPSIETEPQNKHKWMSMFVILLLCFLIALNVILLFKLWSLEERIENDISQRASLPNLATLQELPNSNQEWVELLRQQEILHETELKKWHKVLQTAIELLKKVSAVCEFIYTNDKKLTQQIANMHEEL